MVIFLILTLSRCYLIITTGHGGQGDKPQEFLNMVPRGLLPAMEIDGKVMTESLDIMYLGAKMLARGGAFKNIFNNL